MNKIITMLHPGEMGAACDLGAQGLLRRLEQGPVNPAAAR